MWPGSSGTSTKIFVSTVGAWRSKSLPVAAFFFEDVLDIVKVFGSKNMTSADE